MLNQGGVFIVAIVLGSGGTRGDFQVGALQFLYSRGVRPDTICGASIGSINGLVLAEGERGLEKLVNIWSSFKNNSDMYMEEPWLRAIKPLTIQPSRLTAEDMISAIADKMIKYALFPPMLFLDSVNLWAGLIEWMYSTDKYSQLKSILNLSPTAAKLRSQLDLKKVYSSGIKLRIATVGLESGEVRYITESGYFSDSPDQPVDLIDAALASAAIPGIFPPVKMHTENYVDGGIREMLPVRAAVDMGETIIYAIACSKDSVATSRSFDNSNMVEIAIRATGGIMFNEIQRNEANSPWGVNFKLIQPSLNIHDILVIDPGLISISMAYGYMRAFDIVEGSRDPARIEDLKKSSDEITRLRKKIWKMEHTANGEPGGHLANIGLKPMPDYLRHVRQLKRDLKMLVDERHQMGGADATPPDAENWWKEWERHKWIPIIPTPWDALSSPAGTVVKEIPP